MAIQGFSAKVSESGGDYVSAVLPEDSYQCVIDKVELREGTKYMSTETEMQLLFYIRPLGVAKEFESKLLFFQTTTSFFNGKTERARAGVKASKLYNLIKTVYKFYQPKVKVDEMKPEEITDEVINSLEGKQIMAIVKVTETGKNKVSDIMAIKEEIKVSTPTGGTKTPDEELDEIFKS
jgi:hypothetical protein